MPASRIPSSRKTFTAVLENPEAGMDAAYVTVPFDVEEEYGTRGQVKVKALFDGYPYRGVLANMGTGHVILVRKDIRKAIGKGVGDRVKVDLEKDIEERIVTLPPDLKTRLDKSPAALKFFNTLSYTNRNEYVQWITGAKREDTRSKRLQSTVEKLRAGKKNPAAR